MKKSADKTNEWRLKRFKASHRTACRPPMVHADKRRGGRAKMRERKEIKEWNS